MDETRPLLITRRRLLVAGGAGLVLAACGGERSADEQGAGNGNGSGDGTSTTEAGAETGAGLALGRTFYPTQPVGVEVRLPVTLIDQEGAVLSDGPGAISVRFGPSGGELGPVTEVVRHEAGVPRPYYPLTATLPEPGQWRIVADVDGTLAETVFQVVPRDDFPAVPFPGDPMVDMATPTTGEPRGVDPICTAQPACPLHEVSLDDAIGAGRPIAFLISTPAFCQTAVCGPVLDQLVARADGLADQVTMIHAEVYTDETARQTTEAVRFFGLAWEPSLFLAAPDGTVTERLDFVWDEVELDGALSRLVP